MDKTKVVTTALCIIPPKECWKQIQKIRETYDPAYQRWMPHINFFFPFYKSSTFEECEKILKEPLSKLKPIKICFKEFDCFMNKSSVIFLDPKVNYFE
jgi:2'-5' RNA ligase